MVAEAGAPPNHERTCPWDKASRTMSSGLVLLTATSTGCNGGGSSARHTSGAVVVLVHTRARQKQVRGGTHSRFAKLGAGRRDFCIHVEQVRFDVHLARTQAHRRARVSSLCPLDLRSRSAPLPLCCFSSHLLSVSPVLPLCSPASSVSPAL